MKFKVGDKVRLTDESLALNKSFSGERIISRVKNDNTLPMYFIEGDIDMGLFLEDELILISDTNGIGEYILIGNNVNDGVPDVYYYNHYNIEELINELNDDNDQNDIPDELIVYKKVRVIRRKEKIVWE